MNKKRGIQPRFFSLWTMIPTTNDILALFQGFAPFDLAEKWDNCGLQVGNPGAAVNKVMVALDISMAAVNEAVSQGAQVLLTHHPLFISAPRQIDFSKMPGSAIAVAAQNGVSLVAAHTNVDKAEDGLNDCFAEYVGLTNTTPFIEDAHANAGIGRLGVLKDAVSVKEMANALKKCLQVDHVRVVGDLDQRVKKIAICTGSGGSLVREFLDSGADLYITGDIKYHEARDIEAQQKTLIDVGHFASEIIVVDFLARKIRENAMEAGYDLEVIGFKNEMDPFKWV